jgi:hypothetical protein
MPLAPPARADGALLMIAFMFGAWKKSKPTPHSPMRQAICSTDRVRGNAISAMTPAQKVISPIPPNIAEEYRSLSLPATGAMTATMTGHGVIKNPVSIGDLPILSK